MDFPLEEWKRRVATSSLVSQDKANKDFLAELDSHSDRDDFEIFLVCLVIIYQQDYIDFPPYNFQVIN